MTVKTIVGPAVVAFMLAGCGQPEPELSPRSPEPAAKTLTAALKDPRGEARVIAVVMASGPSTPADRARTAEMLRLLGPDGELNSPLSGVVALKLTMDGTDGPYLPVDGLANPTSITLDREGADLHFRVNGGDAAGSWFCDYFIDKRILTKRACGPSEIGEPTEITTYVERFLE